MGYCAVLFFSIDEKPAKLAIRFERLGASVRQYTHPDVLCRTA
jgi:hypothetical protein